MPTTACPSEFQVKITLQAAGPVRPRTKHQENKLLRAEATITLPFVPYAGLYLTFSKAKKRGQPLSLYLRVRAVEWNVTDSRFECVTDEILGSPVFDEMLEVRGCVRIEEHFLRLQETLHAFGFDVNDQAETLYLLTNWEDGKPKEPVQSQNRRR